MKESPFTLCRLHFAPALGALVFLFSAPAARAVESLVVTTTVHEDNGTSDPNAGTGTSLHEAINYANSDRVHSTLTFNIPEAQKVGGVWTINLIGPLPDLTQSVTMTGPGATLLTVRRNTGGFYRIFRIAGSTVVLSGLTVSNGNFPGQRGGGIRNDDGTLTLSRCIISGNQAQLGGAIFNSGSATLSIISSTISGNQAQSFGGIFNSGGGLSITNSTFSGNSSDNASGAIGTSGNASITNTTFSGNTAKTVGGAIDNSGALSITNSTFSGNSANNAGGAIYSDGGVTLANSIFNASRLFAVNNGNITSQGYNLSSDNGGGVLTGPGDQINTNPQLGPLQNNGGPTPTHALLPGSPAINTGNTTLTIDQRGITRPQGVADDKGAFEVVSNPTDAGLVVTTTQDAETNDGFVSLREAIRNANSDGVNSAITFEAAVFAEPRQTITLNGTALPTLANNGTLSIAAPVAGVEISGNNVSRVFATAIDSNVTLTGLTIRNGNAAGNSAGAISNGGTLLLDSCTLTDNSAGFGGAIRSQTNGLSKPLTLRNCTLSGNTATSIGGAIYNFQGLVIIESSTITGNTAPANQGSGVTSFGETFARTEVRNSIISGNANTDVDFVQGATNSFQSNGYNLIGDGNATGDFNQTGDVTGNADPGLAPLAENGGETQTRAISSTNSPALNTGNTTLTADQRGVSRPQLGADDKGAFELVLSESLVVTTTADEDNGTSDPAFGTGTSLREAIKFANSDGVNSAITFSPTAFAAPRKTITLSGTSLPQLAANGTLSITAPTAGVEISGNNAARVFLNLGNTTMTGLSIRNGIAPDDFGGGIANLGALLLDSCTVTASSAGFGGAIYSYTDLTGTTLTLRNCTLSGNTATFSGGALYNNNGLTVIESSTIAGNNAPAGAGSGVASQDNASTQTEVRNTIIAGNSNTDVDFVASSGHGINSFQSNGYNLVGDGNATGDFNRTGDQLIGNSDPGLAPLADNGGKTQTRALLLSSPARDTGNTTLSVDQRGVPRPLPSGGADDKGAFEFNPPGSLVVTTTMDEDNNTSHPAFGTGTSLREAINFANSDGVNSAITFDAAVFATPRKTITLGGTPLPDLGNDGALSITAPAAGVEVSGNNQSRVFRALGTSVTLTGLTIRNGNAGGDVGGGIANYVGLLLDSCTLIGNNAFQGGAIYSSAAGALTLRNCTLSGNTATNSGGGLHNEFGLTVIESSTIAGNTAPAGSGSGVAVKGDVSGFTRTQVHNAILAGNTNTDVDFITAGPGAFQSNGYNLTGDGNAVSAFNQPGDQIIGNASPDLGPLQNNGGPTFTRRVLLTSFARNTGSSSLSTDQRGLARVFGPAADKGAYELQYESYAFWASYSFPAGTPPALLAPEADYDNDGTLNGIERATGRDPLSPNASADLLLFEIQEDYLVLQFERSFTVDPAAIFAEQSLELQTWSPLGITYQNLGPASSATELIQALIPINGAPKKFGRLRYTP